jgi:hypothetical protein
VAHLTTYLDIESRKILRSGFDFTLNLTSAIGGLANCGFLASYVSRHTAMAYDTAALDNQKMQHLKQRKMQQSNQVDGVGATRGGRRLRC